MRKFILILSLLFLIFITSNSFAINVSRVKTWAAAEILTAADLNAEFDNIIDHEITNADIAASAGIPASKLDLTVASPIGSTTVSTGAFSTLSSTGATTIGDAPADTLHINANTITFEGATANDFEAQLTFTDPTADRTFTFPNADINFTTGLPIANGGTGSTSTTYCSLTANISGILPVANGGTNSSTAVNTANGVVVLDGSGYVPDNSVDTGALKTTTGEVSSAVDGADMTLPGGTYGFYPQVKASSTQTTWFSIQGSYPTFLAPGTTYVTYINARLSSGTAYAQQRYITASGLDYWLFLLIDKTTKDILQCYSAPDHPAYGNGGDFDRLPHPFMNYDTAKQEVILIDNETIAELKLRAEQESISILDLVNNEYKVSIKDLKYKPLHSGQFIDKKPVLVEKIPSYIKVRKLLKLNIDEIEQKEIKQQQLQAKAEQDKIKKEQNKLSAKTKLKELGLTDEELQELVK